MAAIWDSREERVMEQREDQDDRVESMEGMEFGWRSRRGETDDTRTIL